MWIVQIIELKQAILIFQKLRDSFEHRNVNLKLGKFIQIDNEKNFFKVVIPSDYIDGFNKGRIIVKEEDGNINEDKIYLYDEYNEGSKNFNIVMSLNDLINFVRIIQTELNLTSSTKNIFNK